MKAKREAAVVAAGRRTEEPWSKYRERLSAKVSKVRLLGESEWRDLKQVFVKLSLVEEYQEPSARNAWMGFVDAESRRRRALFSDIPSEEEGREKTEKRLINPEELLRDGTHAVITGAPGCGKSTLLRWLTGRCLDDNSRRLPVFLELKSINKKLFDDCRGNLGDLLFDQAIAHLLDEPDRATLKSEFISRLAAHRVAIFLDGLDEVRYAGFFTHLCEAIHRFLDSSYGKNLLLISTRPYALGVRFREAEEMEIAPLNRTQVNDFLKHYYGADPSFDLQGLLQQIGRRELSQMVRVPVLLGALVRRYRETGELTGDWLKLYEDLVHDLVATWDDENNVERFNFEGDDDEQCKLAFLEQVAFKKLFDESVAGDDERLTFTTRWLFDEAKAYCPQFDIKPQDFVADLKATALLREVAKGVWAFSHLTIQEYLAAKALARRDDFERIFCRSYFNPTLVEMEALPMALGMLREPDEIYRAIEQLPESLNFAGLRLRARGLAHIAVISHDLRKQLTDRLINFIRSSYAEETAYLSAYLDAIILSFSGHGSGHSDYIGERVSQLLKDDDSSVRVKAAYALGEIGGERSVAPLIEALKDEDSYVRWKAAEALGKIGGERTVAPLIEALKDEEVYVRKTAAEALGKIGGERTLALLIEALKDERSYVRTTAAYALGEIGGERAVAPLIEALKDEDSCVRWRVVEALGEIGGERAASPLIEALKDERSDVRTAAAEALGKIGGERTVAPLIEALKDERSYVRKTAAEALGKIGGERTVAPLIEALKDEEVYVRKTAAEALRKIGGERTVAPLIEALKDERSYVRTTAAYALEQIDVELLAKGLRSAISHTSRFVRRKTAEVIGYYSNSRDELKLLAETDPVPEVRQAAERALSQLNRRRNI